MFCISFLSKKSSIKKIEAAQHENWGRWGENLRIFFLALMYKNGNVYNFIPLNIRS
jgi:hypothetical protein